MEICEQFLIAKEHLAYFLCGHGVVRQ